VSEEAVEANRKRGATDAVGVLFLRPNTRRVDGARSLAGAAVRVYGVPHSEAGGDRSIVHLLLQLPEG